MTINDKIKFLDDFEKKNGSRLFKKLNVPRTTINSAMSSSIQPRFNIIEGIVKAYENINPNWLFYDDEEPWIDLSTQPDEWDSHAFLVDKVKELSQKNQKLGELPLAIAQLKRVINEQADNIELLQEKMEVLENLITPNEKE